MKKKVLSVILAAVKSSTLASLKDLKFSNSNDRASFSLLTLI